VRLNPQYDLSGEPLDLSYAHLRSVSPIHLEYLRNMGVGASMSISIIVDGELWGLIACHQYAPRTLPMGLRVAAELFGQFFSLHLGAQREKRRLKVATEARAYLDHVLTLTTQHDVRDVLTKRVADFARLMPNDGVALYIDGQWSAYGSAPSPADGMVLARFIGGVADGTIWASHSLVQQLPAAAAYAQTAAGVLAIPLSQTPRDYLLFFRKELTQTLDWAGNPDKTYETGPLGDRLTKRKSLAIWKLTVQQQSQPWTESDRQIAEATRVELVEVVMRHTELLQQERSKADVRQRMLNEELNHRVKNILSVIRSLVGQPPREGQTLRDYVETLKGRIQSLSFAHDQVVRGEGGGLLSELVNAELTPYRSQQTAIRVTDDRVWLDSRAYSVLALVLHELATNAAKYGALSVAGGKLEVRSSLEPTGECVLEWTETGGPRVTPPAREGFGTTLLNRSIPFDLGGESDLHYRPKASGRASCCRRAMSAASSRPSLPLSGRLPADHPDLPRDLRIMLLEDQMLIAMDVESTLADRGFTSVSTVSSVAEALKLVNRAPPAIAILDINLGDGTSLPVAEELALRRIPFVFVTGYGDGGIIPDRFADVPVIRKPYEADALLAALNRIGRG
jgi:light-regulated signal transduction histidine kinase (bacteriophytochrome)/CheY-like chemotaxis protein